MVIKVFYNHKKKYYKEYMTAQIIIIIFKEINTSIQQEHIKLIKSDSKDIYVTKDFHFK